MPATPLVFGNASLWRAFFIYAKERKAGTARPTLAISLFSATFAFSAVKNILRSGVEFFVDAA